MNRGIITALAYLSVAGICVASCGSSDEASRDSAGGACRSYGWNQLGPVMGMTPGYEVHPSFTTPSGVKVDPSTTNTVSPETVDCVIDRIERCLIGKFGQPPTIPDDDRRSAECPDATFVLPFPRTCITLKVPDDWRWNCDHTGQVLRWTSTDGGAGCRAKGMEPTAECPCSWRAGVQDEHTIVSPPNLYLFPDWLVRAFTGCRNPWASPAFAECISPATDPLSTSPTCSE